MVLQLPSPWSWRMKFTHSLVIGGGGSGSIDHGGGGGAGGVVSCSAYPVIPGMAYTGNVGKGGVGVQGSNYIGNQGNGTSRPYPASQSGSNSSFGTLIANGGGGGTGFVFSGAAANGGSGGGVGCGGSGTLAFRINRSMLDVSRTAMLVVLWDAILPPVEVELAVLV